MFISIPEYNISTKKWGERKFDTKADYHAFVSSHFKFPGQYNLKETKVWYERRTFFEKSRIYCPFKPGTRDAIRFWEFEKKKSFNLGGVIYLLDEQEYFIPGDYYFYLNYCPIYDKIENRQCFPSVWDSDLHTYIFLLLCRLEGLHFACLKKRQWGATYKFDEVLINSMWFGNHSLHKVFTFNSNQLTGTWQYLENYRNHLNSHTAWRRPMEPGGFGEWIIRQRKKKETGDWVWIGNHTQLKAFVTEKDPSSPVGGGGYVVFGDEAGKNPTLNLTHNYLLPVVQQGGYTTGLCIYSGAVGELDKCDPLKRYFYSPDSGRFKSVTNIWDEEFYGQPCAFFVPTSWNYIGRDGTKYFDENGNSFVEEAVAAILKEREELKAKTTPEDYQLYISQNPLTPGEAFDVRKESIFPQAIISRHITRLDKNPDAQGKPIELYYDADGKVKFRFSSRSPISVFPLTKADISGKGINREGCVVMWEPPDDTLPFGTYWAGVDPVEEQQSNTSESLCCIYIVKAATEKVRVVENKREVKNYSWKICACWIGRYDDPKKNHETCEMLQELYNARAIIEVNVDSYVKYMLGRKKLKHLVPTDEIKFRPEIGVVKNKTTYKWGFKTNADVKNIIIQNLIEVMKEEIDTVTMSNGKELRKVYGVERFSDKMFLKECLLYDGKINTDRIIALGSVLSHLLVLEKSGYVAKQGEAVEPILVEDDPVVRVRSPFTSVGVRRPAMTPIRRTPFKHLL